MRRRWLVIPEFPDFEASDDGLVRCSYTRLLLRQHTGDRGHKFVRLHTEDEESRSSGVHRLVLMAFVGPPRVGQECRHLNGRETDNRLRNLKWGTRLENEEDKRRHRTGAFLGERNPGARLTRYQVRAIRRRFPKGLSNKIIAAEFNVGCDAILFIRTGRTWAWLK